jgi:hypothetical protein
VPLTHSFGPLAFGAGETASCPAMACVMR